MGCFVLLRKLSRIALFPIPEEHRPGGQKEHDSPTITEAEMESLLKDLAEQGKCDMELFYMSRNDKKEYI